MIASTMPGSHSGAALTRTPSNRWLICASLVILAALMRIGIAQGSSVTVDPRNPKAYARINDALDALRLSLGAIDSVLVAPGAYPETLFLGDLGFAGVVAGTAGAESTAVLDARFDYTHYDFVVSGLRFTSRIQDDIPSHGHPARLPIFRDCVFEAGASFVNYLGAPPNLFDCTFKGDTELLQYNHSGRGPMTGLRFERARLTLSATLGDIALDNCQFMGPVDTALVVGSFGGNGTLLSHIAFDSCQVALAVVALTQHILMTDCRFQDCSTALSLGGRPPTDGDPSGLSLAGAEFERVNSALVTLVPWRLRLSNTTVRNCRDVAFDLLTLGATLKRVRVEHASRGATIRCVNYITHDATVRPFEGLVVDSCEFLANTTSGAVVQQIDPLQDSERITIRNSTFTRNGTSGLSITGRGVTLRGNVAFDNGRDGLALHQLEPAEPDSLVNNTCVLNPEIGLHVSADSLALVSSAVIERNLLVFNGRAGIGLGKFVSAEVRFNDAWRNNVADLVNVQSPPEDNLSLDPQFCAAASGDLTLQNTSPCSPGGFFGIGALPVACPSAVGVDVLKHGVAVHAWPSPSSGGVAFTLPADWAGGRVEVMDIAGRLVWRTRAGVAARRVEWTRQTSAGSAPSGAYFVRTSDEGRVLTTRFVLVR